jgi:ABC-2 type transport system permease protein
MQYKASFMIQMLGHFLITGSEFLALTMLFQRFGQINGWTLPQIALFYGVISVAFAASEGVARAFDIFPRLVRAGDFDRILLRPRPAALQVVAQEFQLMRLGRLLQGLVVLIWAVVKLEIGLSIGSVLLLAFAIAGGVCLFSGLFVLQATLCFWTVESLEIVNCTTYGGVEAAQFPLTIYRPWFRLFFTFVIPLATINYFPAQAILGLDDPLGSTRWIQWMSPAAGFIFLAICLRFWHFGVRHYTSTGS